MTVQREPKWVDDAISHLLRIGVIASIIVILAGLIVTFIHHPRYVSSAGELAPLTDPHRTYPHQVRSVIAEAGAHRGQAIVMIGLLLLIATPVARVAFSIVVFAIEHDRTYVAVTIVVLMLLLASFTLGAAG